jgi:multiple sugar transport system ATP-binding protein
MREAFSTNPGSGSRRAILGIRPSDLTVGAGRDIAISGDVFLVEPIGPVTYVDVDVGGNAVKAVCDPDRAPAVGDRVSLGFQAARVRLFDPDTEARI